MPAFLAPLAGVAARVAASSLGRQLIKGAVSHTAGHMIANRLQNQQNQQPQDPYQQHRYA